jgi:hypothetical protein
LPSDVTFFEPVSIELVSIISISRKDSAEYNGTSRKS